MFCVARSAHGRDAHRSAAQNTPARSHAEPGRLWRSDLTRRTVAPARPADCDLDSRVVPRAGASTKRIEGFREVAANRALPMVALADDGRASRCLRGARFPRLRAFRPTAP